MIVRPRASSFKRTVRFNALLLDNSNTDSSDDDDFDNARDGSPTQEVRKHDKKLSEALHDNNNYVEFRRLIKNAPSTRKFNGNSNSSGSGNGNGNTSTVAANSTSATTTSTSFASSRKSSSQSVTDLKVITDISVPPPCPPNSPQDPAGERDDEPTPRHDDEQSVDARSHCTFTSIAQSTHTQFSIPDGDAQDMRVICKSFDTDAGAATVLEVRTAPPMPMPRHSTDVVVAVEASSVSPLDCVMRRGMLRDGEVHPGFVSGCDFVGTVLKCGEEAFLHGISEGERVASIVRGGSNARYVVVKADQLVKIPDDVDPSEASGAVLPYLMAFQTLLAGANPPARYKGTALKDKRILVAENTGLVGMAIASISKLCGAKKTFIVCPSQHHERVKSLGAMPLDENPETWSTILKKKKVHIMIETNNISTKVHLANKSKYLKTNGRLVRLGTPTVAPSPQSKPSHLPVCLENFCTQSYLAYLSFCARASYYEVFYNMERNQAMFKSDLSHIINLLAQRKIRPKIEKFVLLQDVAECHQEIEKFQLDGAIVCEPWRRGGFDSMIYNT